ncbi:MAG: hypothetical protein WCF99_14585 [Chloroflexales bacterium]
MIQRINHVAAMIVVAVILLSAPATSAQPSTMSPFGTTTSSAPATSAQPSTISMFGMNTYFSGRERISRDGDAGVATLVAKGRQIGVAWAREEMSWGNIERNGKGIWSWDLFDQRLGEAAQAGYGIVGMLLTTPAWATVSDCSQRMVRYASAGVYAADYWCPPANPQDFADYVRAVVERYDGDGINDAPGSPRVAVWQIWNEPNAWETWPGSPAEFASIWQAGYAAAKAADPTAIVTSPGLYIFDGQWRDGVGHGDGLRFLNDVLAARPAIWASFDVLAVHPYMPDVAPDKPGLYGSISLWGRLNMARLWLNSHTASYGGSPRPLWVSEIGWPTCTAAQSYCTVAAAPQLNAIGLDALVGKSEDQQANYLVRAYAIAMALGVQHVSWFQLEDKFDGSAKNFWQEAAIFGTVSEGYRAKPAALAYATMVGVLAGGARFLGLGSLNTFGYSPTSLVPTARFHLRFLTSDNQLVDLLWRNSGNETVNLPLEPGRTAALRDRSGNLLNTFVSGGSARLALNESPIYLIQNTAPGLSMTPNSITSLMQSGAPQQRVSITVSNSGSGAITWSATTNAGWASVETPTGQGYRSTLNLSLSPTGLAPGSYNAILHVTSGAIAQDIPLRLVVSTTLWRSYLPFVGR